MWELKKEIEARKENLIFTLKNKKDLLELEKQHQIYGAIKELSHILELMEQFREEEMMSKPRSVEFSEEKNGESEAQINALKIVGQKVSKFKIPVKIRFAKNDA
jgi:hypothetical protein